MNTKWDIRLIMGIVILLIGGALVYLKFSWIPPDIASSGNYFIKAGVFCSFWGLYHTMRKLRSQQ